MEAYGPATYGDYIADSYDRWPGVAGLGDASRREVPLLSKLASTGPVLELGIGTGRVALPLRATGVEVHGIDASDAMLERLHAKSGGQDVPITVGNFSDVAAPGGPYTLVFVVFNTFFGLLTQHDQVRCFANVARVLVPGGRFLTETFLPDVARFDHGQRTSTVNVSLEEVHLDTNMHDPVAQTVSGQHVVLRSGEPVQMFPLHLRYAYPSELDLMAQLAGLELEARYDGWNHEPLAGPSPSVVSIWRAPTRNA
jgi:ubiquinone/menaquinone biosynthesis C-methylase UbiE